MQHAGVSHAAERDCVLTPECVLSDAATPAAGQTIMRLCVCVWGGGQGQRIVLILVHVCERQCDDAAARHCFHWSGIGQQIFLTDQNRGNTHSSPLKCVRGKLTGFTSFSSLGSKA